MTAIKLAWRMLVREWRSDELRVAALAMVIAVAALVSVSSFSDRLRQALVRQGNQLLAADLVVATDHPARQTWRAAAQQLRLRQSQTVSFRSVVGAKNRRHLAEIKAVDDHYPLRGELRTAVAVDVQDGPQTGGPKLGTVWVDSQLLFLLDLDIGEQVRLGNRSLRVDRLVTLEPDRGGAMFSIAPRLMLHINDLASTGLVQPGSLVTYHWLLAGDDLALAQLRDRLRALAGDTLTFRDAASARPRFRVAFERGERFFALATLVSMLLAGAAVARAASDYAARHLDYAAMLRCLGARQGQIVRVYLWQLLLLAMGAGSLGSLVGYIGQQLLVYLLPGLVQGDLPWPSLAPALIGPGAGVVLAVGFGAPAVFRLRDVSPLHVLRRDMGPLPLRVALLYVLSLAALASLTLFLARDLTLSIYVLGGGLLTTLALAGVSLAAVVLLGRVGRGVGASWRYGLANLARHGGSSASQVVAAGIGVMGLLLLTLVRNDLLEEWSQRLPEDTPNHFLINIQPDQVASVREFLTANGVQAEKLSPLSRGRLVSINGKAIEPADFPAGFARRAVQRAANLSWITQLPTDNQVIAGRAWDQNDHGKPWLSIEDGYAQMLGLRLGDKLVYRVADREVELKIINLRSVSWDSLQPNFFLLVPPGVLDTYPRSYITSVYIPPGDAQKIAWLIKRFANITDIDIRAVLEQVRQIIDRINNALIYIFLFSILAGLVVIYAVVQSGRDERRQEIAVLLALGARRRQLIASVLAEFSVLGLLAGAVGAAAAGLIAMLVARYVLQIQYTMDPGMWALGLIVGTLLVGFAGVFATRRLLRTPPWASLREF